MALVVSRKYMLRIMLQSILALAHHNTKGEECGPDCFCWEMRRALNQMKIDARKTHRRAGQWYYA